MVSTHFPTDMTIRNPLLPVNWHSTRTESYPHLPVMPLEDNCQPSASMDSASHPSHDSAVHEKDDGDVHHWNEHGHMPHSHYSDEEDDDNSYELFTEEDEIDSLLTWFQLHDIDMNGRLDGLELLNAFSEWGNQDEELLFSVAAPSGLENEQMRGGIFRLMVQMVDHALEEDDIDNDGMISPSEFLRSQHF
jgi:hypothetical protein